MSDRITKLQRWLDLVACLASRRFPMTFDEIREHVPAYTLGPDASETERESVRRMFERDKDELRALGIPIETVDYSVDVEKQRGYRLQKRNFHLPYLRLLGEERAAAAGGGSPGARGAGRGAASGDFELTRHEAGAALSGLREVADVPAHPLAPHARSAFRKLSFDLDLDIAGDGAVVFARDPEAVATHETLQRLAESVLARKAVSFDYHGMQRDARSHRRVDPYGLVFQHGRWYLVGHDGERQDVRMFRVGRMSDVQPNRARPSTPDFEVPPDFSLQDYGGRRAWEMEGEQQAAAVEATVLFRFPRSLWAERNAYGSLVEEGDDGSQLRLFRVRRADPFLRWVLSLAPDARVEAPAELRQAFDALVAAVAARYDEVDR
ncbi:MAG: WYL domain-containing protein [Gemmatimonadetes bacterium]|nr:MAG: WYL domain-containing protein [Gemmatimonadota bacterium]